MDVVELHDLAGRNGSGLCGDATMLRDSRWSYRCLENPGPKGGKPLTESDSPYCIVPTPDGKFSVQAYLKPAAPFLDKLTQRQAERLQVYLTELMEDYNNPKPRV